MTKPVVAVVGAVARDELMRVQTIMEYKEQPPLLVMVTDTTGLEGCFTGVDLTTGLYSDNWNLDDFHIFRGEITLSQGV